MDTRSPEPPIAGKGNGEELDVDRGLDNGAERRLVSLDQAGIAAFDGLGVHGLDRLHWDDSSDSGRERSSPGAESGLAASGGPGRGAGDPHGLSEGEVTDWKGRECAICEPLGISLPGSAGALAGVRRCLPGADG